MAPSKQASPGRSTVSARQPATPAKPPTKAKAKPAATRQSATTPPPSTEFRLFAPEANEVCLAGDFSDWQPEECRMRRFKDGLWKKSLRLRPGRYEYRFIVDGHWWTDPENPQRQENPFGQENSVLLVP